MRRHFAALNTALGKSTSEDLRTLGREQVADDLQKAVKACIQQEYADSLAPARAVVAAAWEVLQQKGWDHPAWREAYSFAQLCIAASHISLNDSSSTDPASNNSMHVQPLPSSDSVRSDYNTTGNSPHTDRAIDVSPPAQKAMQALDLASIMGAPPDFLAPVKSITEPVARQQHQAKLAYQVGKHQRSCEEAACQACPAPTCGPSNQCQHNGSGRHNASRQHNISGHHVGSGQHSANDQHSACMPQQATPAVCRDSCANLSLGLILSSVPQAEPQLDPDRAIARRSAAELTAADFKKQYWKTDTPVIITGAMDSWKAMREWPSLKWWNHNHGHRTIPVELGTDSTNSWRETTMLLQTFMTDFMQPSVSQQPDAEVAYIAQHPLFDQLPSLMSGVEQPELMGGEAMQMNAWIGTQGTVTPLHFDSYDNFLAQVC
ncbi:TPA: Lysine-specific demethylase 8, variant 3 [Trebouxia sp. C0004]